MKGDEGMPKVSVIIPTYNRGRFISHAIMSVLSQTYKDYEIIVVDDGSTDDTKKRVQKFGDQVRYIYQKNRGPSAARNTGIRRAKGKYIAFCDSDDQFLPDKLEKQMKYIRKHPECRFLYSWYYDVDPLGKVIKKKKPLVSKNQQQLQYLLLNRKLVIRTSTVLVHQSCFNKAGIFNEKYWTSEDWDMWLRILAYYPGHCLKVPLSEYWRHHGDNISSLKPKKHHAKIRKSALKLFDWNDKTLLRLDKLYKKLNTPDSSRASLRQ